MTWVQFARLWNDYGAFVTLCVVVAIVIAVGVTLLVKFWPVLTRVVELVQTVLDLPKEIGTLNTKIEAGVVTAAATTKDLAAHVEDGNKKFELLTEVDAGVKALIGSFDDRLDRIEAKAGVAAHQTTNNGGSSMKDGVDRTEQSTKRLEQLMREVLAKIGSDGGNSVTINTGPTPTQG